MSDTKPGYQWYAGTNDEHYTVGPFDTREEVTAAAMDQELGYTELSEGQWACAFYITQARKDNVQLANWINVERMVDDAEDSIGDSDIVNYEFDEPPYFVTTPAQLNDLETMVKETVKAWQLKHELDYTLRTFTDMTQPEFVTVDMPPPAELDRS